MSNAEVTDRCVTSVDTTRGCARARRQPRARVPFPFPFPFPTQYTHAPST